jgi:hypothetical protein
MTRTSPGLVQSILQNCYQSGANLEPYIRAANLITSEFARVAASQGYNVGAPTLLEIEGWLAAHAYTKMDPTYLSKTTGDASATYVRGKKEPFLEMALALDPTGMLNAVLNPGVRVGITWMGKTPLESIPWWQRG